MHVPAGRHDSLSRSRGPRSSVSCRWPAASADHRPLWRQQHQKLLQGFNNSRILITTWLEVFFSRRRGHTLEHTADGCPVFPFTSGLLPASEDIPLPQIISWCCMTGRLYAFVDLVMAYCYLSHVENSLIDWLIEVCMVREFPCVPWESRGNAKHRLNSWEREREWWWWTGNGNSSLEEIPVSLYLNFVSSDNDIKQNNHRQHGSADLL